MASSNPNSAPADRTTDPPSVSPVTFPAKAPVPNRGIPAWVLSVSMHVLIFVGLILLMTRFQSGGSEIETRSGGIVLVNREAQTTEYLSEGDVEQTSNPQSAAPAAQAAPDLDLPPELPGMISAEGLSQGAAESIATGLDGANEFNLNQPRGEIGGKVTTEVFGVKGTGSRFVYVVDRSESMQGFGSRPILAARQQLLQSLDSLSETNQFQIIFYNNTIKIFDADGRPAMYFANDDIKSRARRFIKQTQPKGGTDHMFALKQAFRLRPDVIFLLTDAEGGFTAAELDELSDSNRTGAVINTIEFGQRRGRDRSLEAVSRASGGQYLFKNINTLRVTE